MEKQNGAINQFLKPLSDLLDDFTISEIMINRPNEVWFKRFGFSSERSNIEMDELQIRGLITLLASASKKIVSDERSILNRFQIISAFTPGFRFEAWNTPVSSKGPAISIRRLTKECIPLEKYLENKTIDKKTYVFLKNSVSSKRNIVIVGSTGSGKTTFCSSLINCINPTERLIVIENIQELNLNIPNVLYLEIDEEQGYGVERLIESALRGLPDRIIIGELRGIEASGYLKAANTGHPGSITTLHANSAIDGIYRLEEMVHTSHSSNQIINIKKKISQIKPITIFLGLVKNNGVYIPKVMEILEIISLAKSNYLINEIFKFK